MPMLEMVSTLSTHVNLRIWTGLAQVVRSWLRALSYINECLLEELSRTVHTCDVDAGLVWAATIGCLYLVECFAHKIPPHECNDKWRRGWWLRLVEDTGI